MIKPLYFSTELPQDKKEALLQACFILLADDLLI
jgi:hypothetical protein